MGNGYPSFWQEGLPGSTGIFTRGYYRRGPRENALFTPVIPAVTSHNPYPGVITPGITKAGTCMLRVPVGGYPGNAIPMLCLTPTTSHMTSSSRTLSMHRLRLAPHPHSFLLHPHHHQPPYRSLSTSTTSQGPHHDH